MQHDLFDAYQPPIITLSSQELRHAGIEGVFRVIWGIEHPGRHKHGKDGVDWTQDCEGACCEVAVSKYLNRYWLGNLGDFTSADIGQRLQVRGTRHHTGCLILHDDDSDHHAYALVTGHAPTYTLRGWCWGQEGKRPQYWQDPTQANRPAYFVPQRVLRPMKPPTRVVPIQGAANAS